MRALTRSMGVIALIAFAIAVCGAAVSADEVRWQTDLEQARQTAAQTNRLVLVHFWATWCPPCIRLESQVFNQPGVGPALEADYVPVKLNFDEHMALAKQYGVELVPTDLVITPEGELIKKMTSPRTPREYVARMGNVAAGARQQGIYASAPPPADAQGPVNQQQRQAPAHVQPQYAAVQNAPQRRPAQNAAPQYAGPRSAASYDVAAQPRAPQGGPGPDRGGQFRPQPQEAPVQPRYASQAVTDWSAGSDASRQSEENQLSLQGPANGAPAADPRYQGERMPINAGRRTALAETYQGAADAGNAPLYDAQPAGELQQSSSSPVSNHPIIPPQTKGQAPLALEGYCPVHLSDSQKWSKGDTKYGVVHRGRTYLFTTKACQQKFWENPDRYSPVLGGDDPVLAKEQGVSAPGLRQHGLFYCSRVVLFASEETLLQFKNDPSRYVSD